MVDRTALAIVAFGVVVIGGTAVGWATPLTYAQAVYAYGAGFASALSPGTLPLEGPADLVATITELSLTIADDAGLSPSFALSMAGTASAVLLIERKSGGA